MPKNTWLLLLLALGLAGTAVYNISFFASRDQDNSPQSAVTPGIVPTPPVEPGQNINVINGAIHPKESDSSDAPARPVLSMEEIERRARNPVDLPVLSTVSCRPAWPERDPFLGPRQHAPVPAGPAHPAALSVKPTLRAESLPPDPIFKVSAILIEEDKRFALVNGYPRGIGAAVGDWEIIAIQPDHVVVRTPGGERKIEILKQLAHEKPISNQ